MPSTGGVVHVGLLKRSRGIIEMHKTGPLTTRIGEPTSSAIVDTRKIEDRALAACEIVLSFCLLLLLSFLSSYITSTISAGKL